MGADWTVINVETLNEYKILITFEKGVRKIFDMKPYLKYPMYKPLENPSIFNMAHTNGETVVWNDDIDIAPETLYEKGLDYSS